MPVFIHEEPGGKQRLIANGRGGGHNAATSEEETLYVISVSFVQEAAAACVQAWMKQQEAQHGAGHADRDGCLPEWLEFGLGCEDMVDAFRQCPVHPKHQGANVVGYYSTKARAWRFVEVFGMVYGMRSSVVHFQVPYASSSSSTADGGIAYGIVCR